MRVFIISDNHHGHSKMLEYCGRPENFDELILKNCLRLLKHDDLLINLGDVCIGDSEKLHNKYILPLPCKKWLVRGNHDHKSNNFYLSHGWDFIAREFTDTYFGKRILFSHTPQDNGNYDYNVFGHFHNGDIKNQEPYLKRRLTEKHKCFVLENLNYEPVLLERFINL